MPRYRVTVAREGAEPIDIFTDAEAEFSACRAAERAVADVGGRNPIATHCVVDEAR